MAEGPSGRARARADLIAALEAGRVPARLGHRRIGSLGVEDVADLIGELRAAGRSPKTAANALATLQSVLRFARRRGWITADPVELLEPEERPRPPRRPRGRVLGREDVMRLLECCPPTGRLLVETALYSSLRIVPTVANRREEFLRRRPLRFGRSPCYRSSPIASSPIGAGRRSPRRPTGCSRPREARPLGCATWRGAY
jgi:integrase